MMQPESQREQARGRSASNSNLGKGVTSLAKIKFPQKTSKTVQPEEPKISIRSLAKNFNPLTPLKKIIADIKLIRTHNPSLADPQNATDSNLVKATVTSRVVLAFVASEVAAIIFAPTASTIAQYVTKDVNAGIGIALAADFIAASLAYQAVWISRNRNYYSNPKNTFKQNLTNWWKDSRIVHGFGVLASLPVYALTGGIAWGIAKTMSLFSTEAANNIPSALYITPIAGVIGEVVFTGIFAKFTGWYVNKIAPRYEKFLSDRSK